MAQLMPFYASIFHLYLPSLLLASTLVAPKPSGLSLKLISPYSPDSPFYLGNISELERINHMVESSDARVMSYKSIYENPDGLQIPVYKYPGTYVVQLFIGTPRTKQTLIMDTGSSLTWTQCEPCHKCFGQSDPMFTPSKSSTYRLLAPTHHICSSSEYHRANNVCTYTQTYGEGSSTSGVVSLETFTFPYGSSLRPIQNIVFGCSIHNINFRNTELFSGILGLDASPESLVNQLSNITNRRFTYCLASDKSMMRANSVLRFGDDVPNTPNLRRTPFVRQNISPHYHLDLIDISVGARRMGFPRGTFALQPNRMGGFMIDSGSTITYLSQGPYNIVMNAFMNHYLLFGLERVNLPSSKLDFCFRRRAGFSQYIGMTLHFQGADMVLEPDNIYMSFLKDTFCVAIKFLSGINLFGAWQQKNVRFIYDLNAMELQFATTDCSLDRL